MKTDKTSLFFNAELIDGKGTATWATALGQGDEGKINRGEKILIGMDYCSIPVESVECNLGQSDIVKAAVFEKVFIYIDGQKLRIDSPFILLVTKERGGDNANRLSLKYSNSTKKKDGSIRNDVCLDKITRTIGTKKACWFTYDIDVENQDELIFSIIKVADKEVSYQNSKERKNAWDNLISNQSETVKQIKKSFAKWLENNCKSKKANYKKHVIDILEYLLAEKFPNNVKNLFEYFDEDEFSEAVAEIKKISGFRNFDYKDQTCRPSAALNHYAKFLHSIKIDPPVQAIYYGVPGCGKSWTVNKEIEEKLKKAGVEDANYHVIRCVFHPEYSNSDFVGQIYPHVLPNNGGVDYRFKPGPLAEIIRRSYRNPFEPFFLIIEELNRGNAEAIFGENFQLLDRIRPGEAPDYSTGSVYNTGWSCYGVDNIDVNAYIRQSNSNYSEVIKYDDFVYYGEDVIIGKNTAIRFPPNLSIYATMNTSDQNVFALDNAFQRRFKFEMIDNDLNDPIQYDIIIGEEEENNKGVRWGSFCEWINEKILNFNAGLSTSEDKCLGGWFVSTNAITNKKGKIERYENISRKDFAEKVLKYLWHDVFRHGSVGNVFNRVNGKTTFSTIVKEFKDNKNFEAFKKVFCDIEKDEDKLKKTYAEKNKKERRVAVRAG